MAVLGEPQVCIRKPDILMQRCAKTVYENCSATSIFLTCKCCCTVLVNLSFSFPYILSTTPNKRFQLRVVSKITQLRHVESTLENWSMFQNLVQVSVSRRNFDFQAAGEIFSPKSIKEVLASISMYKWAFFGVEVCGKLILAYSFKRFNCVSYNSEKKKTLKCFLK